MDTLIDARTLLSAASFLFTTYFWFVKARKELPNIELHQLSDFRASCRSYPGGAGRKRLCIQQLDTGGVLIVNHSTRQNSIVLFDCFVRCGGREIRGDWGYTGEDKPPWNVGPESAISFSPACFFDVPEDYEVPDDLQFRIELITASGKRFSHRFTKQAPRLGAATPPVKLAA